MRTILDETPRDLGENLASNALTRIAGRNVKVIEEGTVNRVLVRRNTCETKKLAVFFGEYSKHRFVVWSAEFLSLHVCSFEVSTLVEILVQQNTSVCGPPAFEVQSSNRCSVVLRGVAEKHLFPPSGLNEMRWAKCTASNRPGTAAGAVDVSSPEVGLSETASH